MSKKIDLNELKTEASGSSALELSWYLNDLLDFQNENGSDRFKDIAYNGIQVANRGPIHKVATAVTVTLDVIEKTVKEKAQMLIVHHGLFKKGDGPLVVGETYEYVRRLIEHNIALVCYHLPLDANKEVGNNWVAARALGLKECKPAFQIPTIEHPYIGVVGDIDATSFSAFQKKVEQYYGRSAMAAVELKDTITRVALLSGAGDRRKYIKEAARAYKADCYITGRVDENVWSDAHMYDISFLALGHYTTEVIGPRALAKHLQERCDIEAVFIQTKNPF